MMDQEQPFNPQDIEEQVDQLSSSTQKTYGTSHVEQRFLSDLRMVLSVEESEKSGAGRHTLFAARMGSSRGFRSITRYNPAGAFPLYK